MLKLSMVCAAAAFLCGAVCAADNPAPGRFTQVVAPSEAEAAGLKKLNSDQLAVLDALVRRDIATRSSARADPQAPTTFSARLTADERRLTGIDTLSAEERTKLDGAVERHESPALARTLLAPPAYIARARTPIQTEEKKPDRDLHGTFTLQFGWGSGGYSTRTGAIDLNYTDPAGRFSINVGYSETHVKGGDAIIIDDGIPYRP